MFVAGEIQLPPVVDPFQHVNINFDSTSQNLQTLGSIASSSQNQEFQCVTRMSELSEVGDDLSISVGCEGGDILTGCSSYLEVITINRNYLSDVLILHCSIIEFTY